MSAICPTTGRTLRTRLRSAIGSARPLAFLAAAAAFGPVAAPASAAPATSADVQLTGVFARPISATEPQCTPEPDNRIVYGTDEPFDSTKPIFSPQGYGSGFPGQPGYVAANLRSRAEVTPQLQAGAVNDLCFGFTLSPNVEPTFIKTPTQTTGKRLQETPAVPFVAGTTISGGQDGDDLEDSTITLPAGFAGSPDWDTLCTDEQFGLGNYQDVACPLATMAGTVFARASVGAKDGNGTPTNNGLRTMYVTGGFEKPATPLDPFSDGGYVYNLAHGPNEVARLGIVIQPVTELAPVKFTTRMVLAPSGRIQAVVENAPRFAYHLEQMDNPVDRNLLPGAIKSPVYLESIAIRAFGSKVGRDMPQDFVEFGTDCSTPLTANVSMQTYNGAESAMDSTDNVQLTGCESLPFLPSIEVKNVDRRAGVTTGAEINVNLGQTATGPKSALLKDAVVTLPPGLEIGAQVASGSNGLPLCTAAAFAKDAVGPSGCPAGSKAGDVSIDTPLLSRDLVGSVFLGEQSAVGELPPLYLEAAIAGATEPDAPRIKLIGEVKVDENGKLTTTFRDAPQLRFSQLRLTFPGGPNALFSTPRTCGNVKATGTFTSYASATAVNVESNDVVIDQDCDQAAFNPSFSMVPANAQVGASSPTKITIARADRSPWLKDVKVALPAGFLADLKLATECSKADAATGSCPESARMGTVTTVAGVGEQPLTLGGAMYLVERNEGSVAGAVIVVDANIGELKLGKVVVPANINLRTTDAGLTMTTSAPLRFKGIALNLRSIVVDLDRENFPLNPTACGPLRATAELTGDGGQTAAPISDVTYTGCANLPFEPSFSAKLSGESQPKGHPQLDVTMLPRAGDSNLRAVKVVLPVGLASDPQNIKLFCARADFDAGSCPENTKVGTVSAAVSITNDVISGSVYLVRVEGTVLPGLGMSFTGRYSQRVLSTIKIDKDQRLVTEFATIPDLPLRRLDMTIAGGAKSPIINSTAVCKADTAWEATLSGQGGQTKQINQPVACAGLKPTQKLTWSAKTGIKLILTVPAGKSVKSAKLTLPKGFKFTRSKSSRKKNIKGAVVKGSVKGKDTVKISSTSLSVVGGTAPTKITFTAKPKGLIMPKKYKKKLKKNTKLKVKTRIVTNDGTVTSSTLTVKTK